MAYFGGGGVSGNLHPSLRVYIDCFLSSPLPKVYPRGGGPLDQDPVLMRDFRLIRKMEAEWKETQERLAEADPENQGGPPTGDLEDALNQYLEEMGEEPF